MHFMSFVNYRKSKTIFRSSLNSLVHWDVQVFNRGFFTKVILAFLLQKPQISTTETTDFYYRNHRIITL